LKAIPKIDFNNCFEDWKKHWQKYIVSRGEYFEGDEIDLEEQIKILKVINNFTLFFDHSSTSVLEVATFLANGWT